MAGRKAMSRRSVLRGAGAAIALPWLEFFAGRQVRAQSDFAAWSESRVDEPVPRSIFCYVPNGVNINQWVPDNAGADYDLSPTLKVLDSYRDSFTVISGIGHLNARGGHSGADTWLTGADLEAVPGREYSNTVSIDQLMASEIGQETRFPSLEISDSGGTGNAGHTDTLAFDRNGVPLPSENNPQRLFERLFAADSRQSRDATLRRYAERRSILDAVTGEAAALNRRLGTGDRDRLDQYLMSIRETERRLSSLEAWIDVEKPEIDSGELRLNSRPRDAHDRGMWIDVMLDLAYLAFATDTTRVITFQWSREASGFGGSGENHHQLSHHGGDPEMLESLATIDRFHLERLVRFLGLLATTNEGDRKMLDHTMVMYGSGMNSGQTGDHSPDNLPLILAGGTALGLKHGQHLAYDPEKHPPLSNILLTLAQRMNMDVASFQDSTGPFDGLT